MKKLTITLPLAATIKALITLILIASLSACGSSGIEVTTEFRNAQGVKEGAKVYFDERRVGQVINVSEQSSGSIVTMMIEQQAAEIIDSGAAVVVNRIKPGAPLEIYASAAAKQFGLQDGQRLKGLNSMIELVAWSLGDAFQAGTGELTGYVDSFQEYLEGEKFEQDRAQVEASVKEMAEIATGTMKMVEQDLAEAMSEMSVSEQELAIAIQQLGDELSPVAEEMAKSGTALMFELEKFAQGLASATEEEQASGQRLIESIIATIEKLNEAAERGAQRAVDDVK
jgi:paraquat-inducible protein B